MSQYSIAEARNHLPGIVHEVESGATIELTRRGRPVAVLMSIDEYQRLAAPRPTLWEAIETFRRELDLEDSGLTGDEFVDVRDRSPGRSISL